MAKAYRKHVIYTNGNEYGEGDPVIFRLTNGKIIYGIISYISFDISGKAFVTLYIDHGTITIDVDKIDC